MKQRKIIDAYDVLRILSAENKLPLRAARNLFDLRKALAPTYEFYENERRKIIMRLGDTDEKTGNTVVGPVHMVEFSEAIKTLDELDVELPGLPITVQWPKDLDILPEHLWALDGFADIVEE